MFVELFYDSYYNQERKKCKIDIKTVRQEDGQNQSIIKYIEETKWLR